MMPYHQEKAEQNILYPEDFFWFLNFPSVAPLRSSKLHT